MCVRARTYAVCGRCDTECQISEKKGVWIELVVCEQMGTSARCGGTVPGDAARTLVETRTAGKESKGEKNRLEQFHDG